MKKKPWKRLSQSDSEAVMRLVDEYQSSIKRIIVSVLKGQWPDAVDDILQDTYEEICRQLNLIEEAENRRAYVCKIAARLAIQAHRRLGRDLPLDEDVPAPEDLSFNLDTILGVLGERRPGMSQDSRQSLYIYTRCQRMGGKSVVQTMKPDIRQLRPF